MSNRIETDGNIIQNHHQQILKRNILFPNKYNTPLKSQITQPKVIKKIDVKLIHLPNINQKSRDITPFFNHNNKIIRIKRKLFEEENINNNHSNGELMLTGINHKGNQNNYVKRFRNKNSFIERQITKHLDSIEDKSGRKYKNRQFGLSELFMDEIHHLGSHGNISERKIVKSPYLNELFLNKIPRKKPKNLKKIRDEGFKVPNENTKKMLHCFMDYQMENNLTDRNHSEGRLQCIEGRINNIFENIREDTEKRYQELFNSDKIEFN